MIKIKTIKKRFPSDPSLEKLTFLRDPKADGELYAYLLSISYGDEQETKINKSDLPSQSEIARIIAPTPDKAVSRQTIANRLRYLIDQDYIQDCGTYYIINKPNPYFNIPLDTLLFLLHTVKEGVIKTYIYLGSRYQYKPGKYTFTVRELCAHLGLSYNKQSSAVTNWLTALRKFNLIETSTYYENGLPRYRLTNFSTVCPS